MRSEMVIDVAAPGERIFELAHDITRWPELLPHYRKVTIQSRKGDRVQAQMVAVRNFGPIPLPVTWRAEQWPDESDRQDLRLHFRHLRGVTRGMEVTWHIRPGATGSRVSIEHVFSRRLPLLGDEALPAFINRFFIRPIAGRTLATFRDLAERDE